MPLKHSYRRDGNHPLRGGMSGDRRRPRQGGRTTNLGVAIATTAAACAHTLDGGDAGEKPPKARPSHRRPGQAGARAVTDAGARGAPGAGRTQVHVLTVCATVPVHPLPRPRLQGEGAQPKQLRVIGAHGQLQLQGAPLVLPFRGGMPWMDRGAKLLHEVTPGGGKCHPPCCPGPLQTSGGF